MNEDEVYIIRQYLLFMGIWKKHHRIESPSFDEANQALQTLISQYTLQPILKIIEPAGNNE